jgi:hypothetical protein
MEAEFFALFASFCGHNFGWAIVLGGLPGAPASSRRGQMFFHDLAGKMPALPVNFFPAAKT